MDEDELVIDPRLVDDSMLDTDAEEEIVQS